MLNTSLEIQKCAKSNAQNSIYPAKEGGENDFASIFQNKNFFHLELKDKKHLNSNEVDTKENFKSHEEYKNLTVYSYYKEYNEDYENFEHIEIDGTKNKETGFFARVFKNNGNNEVIIAFRGTNDNVLDMKSNEAILKGEIPQQYYDAKKLFENVKKEFPNNKIVLTGHSLGGSLAHLVASSDSSTSAVTFNTLGVKPIVEKYSEFKDNNNCLTYNTSSDLTSNYTEQTGKIRTIETGDTPKILNKNLFSEANEAHSLENFVDLDKAKYVRQEVMDEKRQDMRELAKPFDTALKKVPNIVEKVDKIRSAFNSTKSFFKNLFKKGA